MKCKKCGTELREGATFCHECGLPVKQDNPTTDGKSYVLVTGSEINLDGKTSSYKRVRDSFYKSILILVFWFVPLLPFILGVPIITDYLDVKSLLSHYDNETNIVNVFITDSIRLTSFISFVFTIVAIIAQLAAIILYIAIRSFISNATQGFSFLF